MNVFPPVTGLAALAKSPYPTFGDDVPDPRRPNKDRGRDKDKPDPKKQGGGDRIPAFMPGQGQALAEQLDQGFGGGQQQWREYLNKVYASSPAGGFRPGSSGGGNGGSNRNPVQVNQSNPNPIPDPGNPWGHNTGLIALRGRNF